MNTKDSSIREVIHISEWFGKMSEPVITPHRQRYYYKNEK